MQSSSYIYIYFYWYFFLFFNWKIRNFIKTTLNLLCYFFFYVVLLLFLLWVHVTVLILLHFTWVIFLFFCAIFLFCYVLATTKVRGGKTVMPTAFSLLPLPILWRSGLQGDGAQDQATVLEPVACLSPTVAQGYAHKVSCRPLCLFKWEFKYLQISHSYCWMKCYQNVL